jgi:hypothetical protein
VHAPFAAALPSRQTLDGKKAREKAVHITAQKEDTVHISQGAQTHATLEKETNPTAVPLP